MRGYKIVQEDGKYSFRLIPRNSNNQYVGWSKQYDSQLECVQGVKQLRDLIVDNQIKTLDSPYAFCGAQRQLVRWPTAVERR